MRSESISIPASILDNACKSEFLPVLIEFINTLGLDPAAKLARLQRESETLAQMPDEMRVEFQILGRVYEARVMDIETVYGAHVCARVVHDPQERDYLETVRQWLDGRSLTDEAIQDGASACPFFGVTIAE